MKQIFFKTVREDYRSVYAAGRYSCKYQIGKRHQFHPKAPSFVFGLNGSARAIVFPPIKNMPLQTINHDLVYSRRAVSLGNRVLICFGEVEARYVDICRIEKNWNFNQTYMDYQYVSCDFTIIGEIEPTYLRNNITGLIDYQVDTDQDGIDEVYKISNI